MAQLSGGCQTRDVAPGEKPGLSNRILTARILVLAPHMDDETLACGGTMLLHSKKDDIYWLFATDGAASPAPLLPWTGSVDVDLASQRRREAHAAAAIIGVPSTNLTFLDLPDGKLPTCHQDLVVALAERIKTIEPEFVFVPFRYDVHPDHTALNRAARAVLRDMRAAPVMLEYFVYHRLRFVPGRDVRRAIDKTLLLTVDTFPVAAAKRAALDCYLSQTTIHFPWQDRPTLTEESLCLRCSEPEFFLQVDPAESPSAGFASHRRQIQLACLATRFGKRPKDRVMALLKWILRR
jgi:LmbE family N-acetylglucosaminyl deacetylase